MFKKIAIIFSFLSSLSVAIFFIFLAIIVGFLMNPKTDDGKLAFNKGYIDEIIQISNDNDPQFNGAYFLAVDYANNFKQATNLNLDNMKVITNKSILNECFLDKDKSIKEFKDGSECVSNKLDLDKSMLDQLYNSFKGAKEFETASGSTIDFEKNKFYEPIDKKGKVITTHWGDVDGVHSKPHKGTDFVNLNKKIYASSEGTVIFVYGACVQVDNLGSSCGGGYGNQVIIKHNIEGKDVYTLYGHMESVSVRNGQKVDPNSVLGVMGSTGRSTGMHCHFELREGGNSGAYSISIKDRVLERE